MNELTNEAELERQLSAAHVALRLAMSKITELELELAERDGKIETLLMGCRSRRKREDSLAEMGER